MEGAGRDEEGWGATWTQPESRASRMLANGQEGKRTRSLVLSVPPLEVHPLLSAPPVLTHSSLLFT